jgi:NADH dehydrogenase
MQPRGSREENQELKHVVIVGGGFAGLNCAKKLAKHPNVRVTLIDRNNYHQFQPLLYQVASGALSPSNTAFNLRRVLREHPNVDVKLTEIVSVDLSTQSATNAEGQTYKGDFLVLAAGSQANFFGTPGADKHSYPLYSLRDAEALRSRRGSQRSLVMTASRAERSTRSPLGATT